MNFRLRYQSARTRRLQQLQQPRQLRADKLWVRCNHCDTAHNELWCPRCGRSD